MTNNLKERFKGFIKAKHIFISEESIDKMFLNYDFFELFLRCLLNSYAVVYLSLLPKPNLSYNLCKLLHPSFLTDKTTIKYE